MTIRVAVVGCGAAARQLALPALAESGRTEVLAVVDTDPARAAQTADEWRIAGRYTEVATMLDEVAPDLVVVSTPPGAHREAVVASLDAGAWVWCEKPPALALADYDDMAAHESDGGPYVAFVFQNRFGSAAIRLRERLDAGALGRPLVAVCHTLWYRDAGSFDPPWRGRWATEGGGPTLGHGIHQMDLLLSILGDWAEVTAEMATLARAVETEDVSFATVRFESGAIASIVNSLLSPREASYLRFDFDRATVEVEHLYGYSNADWRWTPAPGLDPADVAGWAPDIEAPSTHATQLTMVLDAMERGERPPASGADGRRSLELVTAMYRSAITGQRVRRAHLTPADPFSAGMTGGRDHPRFAGWRPDA